MAKRSPVSINMSEELSLDDVGRLLRSVPDDEAHWQIRANRDGTVYLTEDITEHDPDLQFWFESFSAEGYVGAKVDAEWVAQIRDGLLRHWRAKTEGFVDDF